MPRPPLTSNSLLVASPRLTHSRTPSRAASAAPPQQYHSVSHPERLAAYAALAGPALAAGGGVFLARGDPAKIFEHIGDAAPTAARTVVIRFPSVEAAVATHDSPGYQAALKALEGGCVRDLRIVEMLA